ISGLIFEAWTRRDYSRIVDSILDSGASEIYVDPPEEETEGAWRFFPEFYKKLLNDLHVLYRFDQTLEGWEVWTRRSSGDSPGDRAQERPVADHDDTSHLGRSGADAGEGRAAQ